MSFFRDRGRDDKIYFWTGRPLLKAGSVLIWILLCCGLIGTAKGVAQANNCFKFGLLQIAGNNSVETLRDTLFHHTPKDNFSENGESYRGSSLESLHSLRVKGNGEAEFTRIVWSQWSGPVDKNKCGFRGGVLEGDFSALCGEQQVGRVGYLEGNRQFSRIRHRLTLPTVKFYPLRHASFRQLGLPFEYVSLPPNRSEGIYSRYNAKHTDENQQKIGQILRRNETTEIAWRVICGPIALYGGAVLLYFACDDPRRWKRWTLSAIAAALIAAGFAAFLLPVYWQPYCQQNKYCQLIQHNSAIAALHG